MTLEIKTFSSQILISENSLVIFRKGCYFPFSNKICQSIQSINIWRSKKVKTQ